VRLFALLLLALGCATQPAPPPDDPGDTPPMPTVSPTSTTDPPPPLPTDEPPGPPPPENGTPCERAKAHALNYYCPLGDPEGGTWLAVCELAADHARDLYSCVLEARSCAQIRDCESR
jgi:hypothetical protein